MKIVVTEFIDERALPALRAKHDVVYDAKLVDDAPRLLKEAASADAIIVRNRTQVRGELLSALKQCRVVVELARRLSERDPDLAAAYGF